MSFSTAEAIGVGEILSLPRCGAWKTGWIVLFSRWEVHRDSQGLWTLQCTAGRAKWISLHGKEEIQCAWLVTEFSVVFLLFLFICFMSLSTLSAAVKIFLTGELNTSEVAFVLLMLWTVNIYNLWLFWHPLYHKIGREGASFCIRTIPVKCFKYFKSILLITLLNWNWDLIKSRELNSCFQAHIQVCLVMNKN